MLTEPFSGTATFCQSWAITTNWGYTTLEVLIGGQSMIYSSRLHPGPTCPNLLWTVAIMFAMWLIILDKYFSWTAVRIGHQLPSIKESQLQWLGCTSGKGTFMSPAWIVVLGFLILKTGALSISAISINQYTLCMLMARTNCKSNGNWSISKKYR